VGMRIAGGIVATLSRDHISAAKTNITRRFTEGRKSNQRAPHGEPLRPKKVRKRGVAKESPLSFPKKREKPQWRHAGAKATSRTGWEK